MAAPSELPSKILSSNVFLSYLYIQIQALNGKKFREVFQDPRMRCSGRVQVHLSLTTSFRLQKNKQKKNHPKFTFLFNGIFTRRALSMWEKKNEKKERKEGRKEIKKEKERKKEKKERKKKRIPSSLIHLVLYVPVLGLCYLTFTSEEEKAAPIIYIL